MAVVAAASLVAASTATAGPRSAAATICPKLAGPGWFFSASNKGTKYQIETTGRYPCKLAAAWVKKLVAKTLPSSSQNIHYKVVGPRGFTCEASPDKHRRAFTGSCEAPTATATSRGFDWTNSIF